MPSLLTLGNAACGFGCITYAAKVGSGVAESSDLNVLCFAALLIFVAMLFDALDGPLARLTRLTSAFGAELDSLSDAISFGVAPAFLMLKFSAQFHPVFFLRPLLWVIAILYVVCAILRLARFNVTKDGDAQHRSFRGLPSPAAAGMVASMVIVMPGLERLAAPDMTAMARWVGDFLLAATSTGMPLITLCVACLMVSGIRYPHMFNHFFHGRHTLQNFAKLIFALLIMFLAYESIAILFLYFVLASPVQSLWRRILRRAGTVIPAAGELRA
jgi:CDP-diacylglycerol--serine O-phosphatidyltransferase